MTDRFISRDVHMDLSQLPADLWTTRLPASLLDRAPGPSEQKSRVPCAAHRFLPESRRSVALNCLTRST
jgi:hypothetical protein